MNMPISNKVKYCCRGFRIPLLATTTALNNLAHRQEQKTSVLDVYLKSLAVWISRHVRLSEYRRVQLQTDLVSAGISLSPEMHIANSVVKALLIAVCAVPAAILMPILTPVILALAVFEYFKASKSVADRIKLTHSSSYRTELETKYRQDVMNSVDLADENYRVDNISAHGQHQRRRIRESRDPAHADAG